jgi:hypothetical protein
MKTFIISSVILLALVVNSYAQISLTSTSNPVLGDIYTKCLADTNGIQPGPAGANQTWDFSNLQISTVKSIVKYVDPTTTTYGSKFPSATLAAEENLPIKNYIYMTTSANDIIIKGTADTLYQPDYSLNNHIYITYPFSYDSVLSDTYLGTFTIAGTPLSRNGTWSLKGDGYGTLKLPSGTYNNVLRLHAVQKNNDVFFTTTITTDAWYSAIDKFPLLLITKSIRSGGANSVVRTVAVNSAVVGVEEISMNKIKLEIHPNPARNESSCSFQLKERAQCKLILYDAEGRIVKLFGDKMYEAVINYEKLDLSEISAGVYFLSVIASSEEAGRARIIKQ